MRVINAEFKRISAKPTVTSVGRLCIGLERVRIAAEDNAIEIHYEYTYLEPLWQVDIDNDLS